MNNSTAPTQTPSVNPVVDSARPAFMAEEVAQPATPSASIPPTDPPTPTSTTPPSSGGSGNGKKVLAGLGVILLVGATAVGVMLARNAQLTQSTQAADCTRYNFTVTQQGLVTVINGSTASVPPNSASVSVNSTQVGSFSIPSLAPGQSSQLGTVDVPTDGVFNWEVTSTGANCSDTGNFASTGTNTTSTTPTSAPLCSAIGAFNTSWVALTATDLSALKVGDRVRFTATATSGVTVDAAQFTINGVERPQVATKRPGTNDFYDEYIIPAGTTTFKIEAKLHDIETDTWK